MSRIVGETFVSLGINVTITPTIAVLDPLTYGSWENVTVGHF